MSSLWDSFQVYNRSKHSKDPECFGTNHSNIGTGKTTVMYAKEYRKPKKDTKQDESQSESDSSRRSSMSEDMMDKVRKPGEPPKPKMVDISTMTQNEFKRLYESMREGEPDNKVNF